MIKILRRSVHQFWEFLTSVSRTRAFRGNKSEIWNFFEHLWTQNPAKTSFRKFPRSETGSSRGAKIAQKPVGCFHLSPYPRGEAAECLRPEDKRNILWKLSMFCANQRFCSAQAFSVLTARKPVSKGRNAFWGNLTGQLSCSRAAAKHWEFP